jgi:hypothetical protein
VISADGAMDKRVQGGEAIGSMIPKNGGEEGTLESVCINLDPKDGVGRQVQSKDKDVLGSKLASTRFAFDRTKKSQRSVGRNAPANQIIVGGMVWRAGVAESEVDHMVVGRSHFGGGAK